MYKRLSVLIFTVLLVGIILQTGCTTTQSVYSTAAFRYDQAAFPKAKPWTSEAFKNNPEEFQFAVIGDRTGGSDPGGIFNRAMDQLNLLSPEFVINVGDLVEGYTEEKAKAAAQWDEIEGIIKTLEMPFFYVVGNHDMGNDTMREVWLDRRGATYYHFIYHNVLFLVFNSEDPSNPIPKDIEEKTATFKKLQKDDPAAAQALLGEFMASLDEYKKPMVMSDKQLDYFKKVLADNPTCAGLLHSFISPTGSTRTREKRCRLLNKCSGAGPTRLLQDTSTITISKNAMVSTISPWVP